MICATNRPDVLDPALMRPGRLDRKIEIPLPGEAARVDILKIHAAPITKKGELDYESVCKLADGFNAADLRNVRHIYINIYIYIYIYIYGSGLKVLLCFDSRVNTPVQVFRLISVQRAP